MIYTPLTRLPDYERTRSARGKVQALSSRTRQPTLCCMVGPRKRCLHLAAREAKDSSDARLAMKKYWYPILEPYKRGRKWDVGISTPRQGGTSSPCLTTSESCTAGRQWASTIGGAGKGTFRRLSADAHEFQAVTQFPERKSRLSGLQPGTR
jgi:hypothetical protein